MNPDLATVNVFIDELAKAGVRDVCVSPGSRSTPLTMAVTRHGGFQVWLLLDERSAGFFAVGLAKSTGRPVALVCTSGTAAANYAPAVLEAAHGGAPLIVLTADRPHELRQVGSNQTVDQVKLYGSAVKWHLEMPVPAAEPRLLRQARAAAWRAVVHAQSDPPGPVHLNWPFQEPLVPPPASVELASTPGVQVFLAERAPSAAAVEAVHTLLSQARRPLLVCGPQPSAAVAAALCDLARAYDIPLFADPLSQIRSVAADDVPVIDGYDMLLRDEEFAESARPDVVLRFGRTPTSKTLGQYLERHATARQILLSEHGMWHDPFFTATDVVESEPVRFCEALLANKLPGPAKGGSTWTTAWRQANATAWSAANVALTAAEWSEAQVLPKVAAQLPENAMLFVGNSMPVRDLDSFVQTGSLRGEIMANRGVSGIDGVVSTALGCSAGVRHQHRPVVLVIGDVSFYHDLNGLYAATRYGLQLCVVLIHNDGGGIFSFLPQAQHPDTFEYFDTPHGVRFGPAVSMYGGRYVPVKDWDQFDEALAAGLAHGGLTVIEVRMDKGENVQHHQQIFSAVHAAVRDAGVLRLFRDEVTSGRKGR